MAKWAFLTVLLYIFLVVTILIPVICWGVDLIGGEDNTSEFFDLYSAWPFWIGCGIVILAQILLLLFPISRVQGRQRATKSIWVTIVTTAILFSLLHLGLVASVAAVIWGDEYMEGESAAIFWILAFIVASWGIWASVFYGFARTADRTSYVQGLTAWLLRSSILELLVALCCHIIVRRKGECCAPGLTFFGIAAGLAIAALAFGPGLFFLFTKRIRDIKPNTKSLS